MLKAIEKILAHNAGAGELTLPDLGKAEAVERSGRQSRTRRRWDAWVKACRHLPTFARPVIHTSRGLSSLPKDSSPTDGTNRKEKTSGILNMRH